MIRLFEMFAGYGGASFALKKAGIEHKVVGYSEIDKYAIQCYEQNHNYEVFNDEPDEDEFIKFVPKNFGDCTKIDPNELPDFDLLTGGFPCQSFSTAGKGLGEQDTRGTLFHEIIRIAEVKKPSFMLLENVKGLTFKQHEKTFKKILSELGRIGYIVKWKVLNSKDYGIPQNRERVWFVCFKEQSHYDNFNFPEKEELEIFLKDVLETEVDNKFYLSDKAIDRILVRSNSGKLDDLNGIAKTITACNNFKGGRQANIIQINNPSHSNNGIYSDEGTNQTLNCMQGGNRQPFIKVRKIVNNKNKIAEKQDWTSYTLTSSGRNCGNNKGLFFDNRNIRKLTPKECFRLMGFLNDEINIDGISNTRRYRLAGNGWDINLVSKLFKEMFNPVILKLLNK